MTLATLGELLEYHDTSSTYSLNSFCIYNSNNTVATIKLNDYLDILKGSSSLFVFSEKQLNKYIYNTRALARDLYGDENLEHVILMINNMTSPKEFSKHRVYLLKKDTLFNIMNDIYNHEKEIENR